MMQIGFMGGTGIEGKGLALRFAMAGVPVILGSRSAEKAQNKALEYNEIVGKAVIEGRTNEQMIQHSEIVFLTLPFTEVVPAIESIKGALRPGMILVDVTVPVRFTEGRVDYLEKEAGSNAEEIARAIPLGIDLVGAFKTIPAHVLADLTIPLACDVFVCGESSAARQKVMEVARLIPTLRPMDAGPLRAARTLERMTILAIQLNRRYKSKAARFSIVGI